MVAVAAVVVLMAAGAVVLVTAEGPKPEAADRSDEPFLGFPEDFPGTNPPQVTVQVAVRCPAIGKSPIGAYSRDCWLRQLTALAQACADPGTETVDLLVLLVAPDGHAVNGIRDSASCGVRGILVA